MWLTPAAKRLNHSAGTQPIPCPYQPARKDEHDQNEQNAKDDLMDLDEGHGQLLAHQDEEDRAKHRPADGAEAADESDQQRVERPLRSERCRRIVADLLEGKQSA